MPSTDKGLSGYAAETFNCKTYTYVAAVKASTGVTAAPAYYTLADKTWGDAMTAYKNTQLTNPDNHNFDNTGANWAQGGPGDMHAT